MIDSERAQLWARKDQLLKALSQLSMTDTQARAHIGRQIEACDEALREKRLSPKPRGAVSNSSDEQRGS